jgi:hypothetical protein
MSPLAALPAEVQRKNFVCPCHEISLRQSGGSGFGSLIFELPQRLSKTRKKFA